MDSSTAGHGREYDEGLLNAAPSIDRRQVQEGYDADILAEEPTAPPATKRSTGDSATGSPTTTHAPKPGNGTPTRELERGSPTGAHSKSSLPPAAANGTSSSAKRSSGPQVRHAPTPEKPVAKPFYKTKKGIIIIGAVLVAIIVAAVVGGVVGSRGSSNNSSPPPAPATTTSNESGPGVPNTGSTGGQDQGQGTGPGDQQQTGGAPSGGDAEGAPPDVPSTGDTAAGGGTGDAAAGAGGPDQFDGLPTRRRRSSGFVYRREV